MENADLQSRKMMGSNPSTRANMVASTRGLSHRPLFGLVINMSAILIPSTTRRSHGFESRCDYQTVTWQVVDSTPATDTKWRL